MDIIISNSSGQPIYEQICRQVKGAVAAGKLKPGEPLPSIRSLARDLRISVITTKRAYEELERDGFIQTVAGKGPAGWGAGPGEQPAGDRGPSPVRSGAEPPDQAAH